MKLKTYFLLILGGHSGDLDSIKLSTGQGLTRTTNKLLALLSPFTWETFHVEQRALNSN